MGVSGELFLDISRHGHVHKPIVAILIEFYSTIKSTKLIVLILKLDGVARW